MTRGYTVIAAEANGTMLPQDGSSSRNPNDYLLETAGSRTRFTRFETPVLPLPVCVTVL